MPSPPSGPALVSGFRGGWPSRSRFYLSAPSNFWKQAACPGWLHFAVQEMERPEHWSLVVYFSLSLSRLLELQGTETVKLWADGLWDQRQVSLHTGSKDQKAQLLFIQLFFLSMVWLSVCLNLCLFMSFMEDGCFNIPEQPYFHSTNHQRPASLSTTTHSEDRET